jgi:Fibronectin type III domain
MKRLLTTAVVTAGAVALILPSIATPAAARADRPEHDATTWCATSGVEPPCIESVTRDGTAILASDPTWDVSIYGSRGSDGAYLAQWNVAKLPAVGSYVDMGTGEVSHTWSITVDMGTHVPRETDEYVDGATVTRLANNDGTYTVTITGNPVTMGVNAECDDSVTPAHCPFEAGQDVTNFAGEISDFQQWGDSSQWNDFYGMDESTNVEVTYVPPEISGDPAQIVEPLANSHELATGAVFEGFYHITIPNTFLEDMGVDDPTTLGTDGLAATIGSGTATITPGSTSTQVDVTGITFSPRKLTIKRGKVRPTRPTSVHASRSSSTHGRVTFHHARPRGSRIVRYEARCFASHLATRTATGKTAPLHVVKLAAHRAYSCEVRAKAKAGYGPWSERVTLRR